METSYASFLLVSCRLWKWTEAALFSHSCFRGFVLPFDGFWKVVSPSSKHCMATPILTEYVVGLAKEILEMIVTYSIVTKLFNADY